MIDTIRNAHSFAGITSGCFRYKRNNVRAAFLRTKFSEVLYEIESLSHDVLQEHASDTHGEINSLCTSSANASANVSVPPPGSATPAVAPQPTTPTLPSPASFDILPDLHKLLSRLIQTSGQPADASSQPGQPAADAPLDAQHLATAATEVKLKIQRARRAVLALPDIHRTCQNQQDEIEDLSYKTSLRLG